MKEKEPLAIWYTATRSDWKIKEAFTNAYVRNRERGGAALFCRSRARTPEVEFYFNPKAAKLMPNLLNHFGAKVCPAPKISELALLVGEQGLIPDERNR